MGELAASRRFSAAMRPSKENAVIKDLRTTNQEQRHEHHGARRHKDQSCLVKQKGAVVSALDSQA